MENERKEGNERKGKGNDRKLNGNGRDMGEAVKRDIFLSAKMAQAWRKHGASLRASCV